jgi:SPP1 family predicted phage head-tail adaptor
MRAGALRHRVSIQKLDGTRDSLGAENQTWINVMTSLPASIEQVDGRELVSADRIQAEATHRIVTRFFTNSVTPKMRIFWPERSRTFDILSIANQDFRNRQFEFVCKERI